MKKRILVLGASGLLGRPVARQLQEDGFQVRGLSRNPEKAGEMFGESLEMVAGDARERESLRSALDGCTGVHISLPTEAERIAAVHIAHLAPETQLERISYISGSTVFEKNSWFSMVETKLRAEEAIRDSGVPYTIFCPTWPMEMLLRFVQAERVTMMGKQPHPWHWFAADDFARMVSAAYGLEEAANKRFFVHGPQAILMQDALERARAALRPEIPSVSAMPLWLARVMGTVTRNEMLKFAAELIGYFEKTPEGGDPAEANRLLGAPETTLDAWLEARAKKSHGRVEREEARVAVA